VKPRQLLRPQLHLQLQRPRPEGSNTNHPKLPALHETRKRKAMIIPPKCAAQRTRPERSSPTLSRQNSASSACTGEDLAARNLPAPVGKEGKAANVKAAACGPPTAMKTNNGRACQAPSAGNASVTGGILRHSQTSTSAVDPPWRNDGTPQNVQIPPQPKAPQPKGRCQPPLQHWSNNRRLFFVREPRGPDQMHSLLSLFQLAKRLIGSPARDLRHQNMCLLQSCQYQDQNLLRQAYLQNNEQSCRLGHYQVCQSRHQLHATMRAGPLICSV